MACGTGKSVDGGTRASLGWDALDLLVGFIGGIATDKLVLLKLHDNIGPRCRAVHIERTGLDELDMYLATRVGQWWRGRERLWFRSRRSMHVKVGRMKRETGSGQSSSKGRMDSRRLGAAWGQVEWIRDGQASRGEEWMWLMDRSSGWRRHVEWITVIAGPGRHLGIHIDHRRCRGPQFNHRLSAGMRVDKMEVYGTIL